MFPHGITNPPETPPVCPAVENVVVRLHDVIVRRDSRRVHHLRQAGEVRIRLAVVHVFRTVEDDYLVVPQYLRCYEDFLIFFRKVAEHEFDVNFCSVRRLGALDHDSDVVGGGI